MKSKRYAKLALLVLLLYILSSPVASDIDEAKEGTELTNEYVSGLKDLADGFSKVAPALEKLAPIMASAGAVGAVLSLGLALATMGKSNKVDKEYDKVDICIILLIFTKK
uniref:Uncharacterized protein n=1 Tax=Panagrolaimus sp. ES5 TaxID=591445 RepID=A0AC34FKH2_9BILA